MISFLLSYYWEQRKLGELGTITTGSTPSTSIPDYYSDDGIVWVTPTDICENITFESARKLSDLGQQVGRVVPKNTILVTCIASIGKNTMLGNTGSFNQQINGLTPNENECDPYFLLTESALWSAKMKSSAAAGTMQIVNRTEFSELKTWLPSLIEQQAISDFFRQLDNLITLHQRKFFYLKGGNMIGKNKNQLFYCYFEQWINLYKEGAVRKITLQKYKLSLSRIKEIAPKLKLKDIDRITYQNLLNEYAKNHERQTTMDFHHHLKASILDAVDEGLINKDPTRKVVIKGKSPREKKKKYLNQFELHTLLNSLDLGSELNYDWLILIIAKTGMRFSEAIALTPNDFDFQKQILSINKTWNYKDGGGFQPTKNKSSVRKIQLDWMVVSQFASLTKNLSSDKPIFLFKEKIFNSTINDILKRHCEKCSIPIITVHGLRHTHASLLLFGGVSIASVAKRLGHSSMNTTERTYLHVIRELENKDVDLVMRSLSGLC